MSSVKRVRKASPSSPEEEAQDALREKCRDLAKKRRDEEADLIGKLASLLPFPASITEKLDKGSILRLTVYYLRMKKYSQTDGTALLHELNDMMRFRQNGYTADTTGHFAAREGHEMLHCMNGFLIFVCRYGNIYYVSPHVEEILGLKMEHLIGHNILEFTHPDDRREMAKQFCERRPPGSRALVAPIDPDWDCMSDAAAELEDLDLRTFVRERLFYVRLKAYMQKPGQRTRQASYVMLQWSGRLKLKPAPRKHCGYSILGLVAICRPMETRSVVEVRLDGNMFTSHHDLAMKFVFCDASRDIGSLSWN